MTNWMDFTKQKILQLADPNDPYSQEDFDRDFPNGTEPKMMNVTVDEDFYKIKLNFTNESTNEDPEFATAGSSGFDLRAKILDDDGIVISSGKIEIIPTGLYFELPDNTEIQIRPRSGLAAKQGITVLNTPGTIDADYRGEIKVILINHSDIDFKIHHGDRIAQGVLGTVLAKNAVKLIRVDGVSDNTERGSGGFGSTGVK